VRVASGEANTPGSTGDYNWGGWGGTYFWSTEGKTDRDLDDAGAGTARLLPGDVQERGVLAIE